MNQIICNIGSNKSEHNRNRANGKNSKKKMIFKVQFFILTTTLLGTVGYYTYSKIDILKKEKISKDIAQSFGITKIYNESRNYDVSRLNQEIILTFQIGKWGYY